METKEHSNTSNPAPTERGPAWRAAATVDSPVGFDIAMTRSIQRLATFALVAWASLTSSFCGESPPDTGHPVLSILRTGQVRIMQENTNALVDCFSIDISTDGTYPARYYWLPLPQRRSGLLTQSTNLVVDTGAAIASLEVSLDILRINFAMKDIDNPDQEKTIWDICRRLLKARKDGGTIIPRDNLPIFNFVKEDALYRPPGNPHGGIVKLEKTEVLASGVRLTLVGNQPGKAQLSLNQELKFNGVKLMPP